MVGGARTVVVGLEPRMVGVSLDSRPAGALSLVGPPKCDTGKWAALIGHVLSQLRGGGLKCWKG